MEPPVFYTKPCPSLSPGERDRILRLLICQCQSRPQPPLTLASLANRSALALTNTSFSFFGVGFVKSNDRLKLFNAMAVNPLSLNEIDGLIWILARLVVVVHTTTTVVLV